MARRSPKKPDKAAREIMIVPPSAVPGLNNEPESPSAVPPSILSADPAWGGESPRLPRRYEHKETSSIDLGSLHYRWTKWISSENLPHPPEPSKKRPIWQGVASWAMRATAWLFPIRLKSPRDDGEK